MKLELKAGTTSQRAFIFVQDSSKTDGSGLAGLAYNSGSLTWRVAREDDGNAGGTSVTLATATLGTFASGGFKEKDATNMPGIYEIGIPNTALASGSKFATMMLKGATNMAPVLLEIQLVAYDPFAADQGILDLANGVETGYTVKQSLRLMLSTLCGKVTGMNAGTPVFRNVTDSADRVTATTDSYGNRSAVTLTP